MAATFKLLDLFCGAGGCSMGYSRAGFEVLGVDLNPKPLRHYPFPHVCADALEYCREHGHEYDVIHASPPCQAYTSLKAMWNSKPHADLVGVTRETLIATGKHYVIENVPGAPLRATVMLCGTMFGLGVDDAELRRHRLFETNPALVMAPECRHFDKAQAITVRQRVVGVYGHSGGVSTRERNRVSRDRRRTVADPQPFSQAQRAEAMGIDWMTGAELSQALPPAYTEFIGRQLMEILIGAIG